jgi:hypothetical protein
MILHVGASRPPAANTPINENRNCPHPCCQHLLWPKHYVTSMTISCHPRAWIYRCVSVLHIEVVEAARDSRVIVVWLSASESYE